jgi:hypothetical protein
MRGRVICRIRAISAGVRPRQAFGLYPLAFSLALALQGQGFGGEGAGGRAEKLKLGKQKAEKGVPS